MKKQIDVQKNDLKRRILNTARHLLLRDGYASLSMRKIARAIDYSATSIYLYFDGKDDLFQALVEEGMKQLYRALQQTAARHTDPVARLEALSQCYVQYGLDNPEYYEIMFVLHPEHVAPFPADKYRRARRNLELFSEALAQGAKEGRLQVEEPRTAASSIWATLHGTVALLLARRIDAGIEQEVFIQTTIRQAIRGVLPPDVSRSTTAARKKSS